MRDRSARLQQPIRHLQLFCLAATLISATPACAAPVHAETAATPDTGEAVAADATPLEVIDIVGLPTPLADFPGAVSVIDGARIRAGQRRVNLSESLARVPGISVLDRQNYAQDLQIQSRGFGARSTFGIRGIKLLVDGIPSSAADGQGQAANYPLDMLDRIDVVRGPIALQYGNAAGGALIGHSELDGDRGSSVDAWYGSSDSRRLALSHDAASADRRWQWRANLSRFATAGERPHSAAERTQLAAIVQWQPRAGERVRLVANGLSQPDSEDPLGLTREQWLRDAHGTDPVATAADARKRTANDQAGLQWQRDYAPGRSVLIDTYAVRRDIVQFLALPAAAQNAPGSAGGVIDLKRRSRGANVAHRWNGERIALTAGIELTELDERRRGYENFVGDTWGVRGALRRNEANRAFSREAYLVSSYRPAAAWTLLGGWRHSRIAFSSQDYYQAAGNGDDSGALDYAQNALALGTAWSFDRGEVFASAGRGFETPTMAELAYRADGTNGLNRELVPARHRSVEIGARWRVAQGEVGATLWQIASRDEIVPAQSLGGRASFSNADRTRRNGAELSYEGRVGERWSYALAATWTRAVFSDAFSYRVAGAGTTVDRTVAAGNRVPGIPRATAYAELVRRHACDCLTLAWEGRFSQRIAVDDVNSDSAPGYVHHALRLEWRSGKDRHWHGFVRIDNLLDTRYVSSVIVNEANRRFFEPGSGRTLTAGAGWGAP